MENKKMFNKIISSNKCCICGSCVNACPKKAISINDDHYFFQTQIDFSKCIGCNLCSKVCPLLNKKKDYRILNAYGGWAQDPKIINKSSSGGIFTIISNYVLQNNGVVFGATFSHDFKKIIFQSTNEVDLNCLKKSKYSESNVGYTFKKIKEILSNGTMVLFSGAPCQVAGLIFFLGKHYHNLITIDFACYGFASHFLYESHLKSLERKFASSISSVDFRSKKISWNVPTLSIEFKNKKKYFVPFQFDPYCYAFQLSHVSIRESCLECKFRDNHYSDFTLSDFWEWKKRSNLENNKIGISLILVNSYLGQDIFKKVQKDIFYEKIDVEDASYNTTPFYYDQSYYLKRELFFKCVENKSLKKASIKLGMYHGLSGYLRRKKVIIKEKK